MAKGDNENRTIRSGPLRGLRVVELATVIMGPYAGQLLAGMGAEVIKVEDEAGDSSRSIGGGPHPQLSGVALNLHANKRSVALNLKHNAGRDAFLRILDCSDVLITNLRPGPLARLRLSYDDVSPGRPKLVYCQAAGFRSDSDLSDRPAFDDIIQAMAGIPALNAKMGQAMSFMPVLLADKVSAMAIVNSVLAALLSRSTTGVGQRVEVPMFDTLLAFNLVEHLAQATVPGGHPGYSRTLTRNRGPHRTADGWVALLPYTDRHWEQFYEAVGCSDLLNRPWHKDLPTRLLNADKVYSELAGIVALRTTAEWLELCEKLDIPASEVPTLDDLVSDPRWHRGVLADANHPVVGAYQQIRSTPIFSATPAEDHFPAPLVGQDTAAVLAGAGLSDSEIDALFEEGVVSATSNPPVELPE